MQKATSSLAMRGVARSTIGSRRLFSSALGRTTRSAFVSSRATSALVIRCTAAPLPVRPQQRWYSTEDNEKEADEAQDSVQAAIKKVVSESPCVLFMKGTPDAPQCGFSNATVKALNAVGAVYEAFDVLQSPELREGVKKFSDWPTIPQVYIGGEFVGGCDITLQHLRSGELTNLLAKAKALKDQQ